MRYIRTAALWLLACVPWLCGYVAAVVVSLVLWIVAAVVAGWHAGRW